MTGDSPHAALSIAVVTAAQTIGRYAIRRRDVYGGGGCAGACVAAQVLARLVLFFRLLAASAMAQPRP
jgi:hypothetical protein